ncbi:MAG: LysR family transcriptional regulator [Burkholderiaceae bacterium]
MDRLTAASVFLETVARGSISAAAKHLEMSRAMATRYVGLMEEWAGSRLLHRTTRRLSLTPAGELLLPVCRQMLELSGEVGTLGAQADDMPRGLVRVTAPSILAEYCLTDALVAFQREHPGVAIDLQIVDSTSNLAAEGIDLALRVTREPDPGVIARRLGTVRSLVCASPSYLAAHGTPQHVRDLAAHHCVTYAHYGRSLWHFRADGEPLSAPVSGNFSTNEAAIVVRAAIGGAGLALLPEFAARQAIAEGRLVRVLASFELEALGLFAIYLSRKRMPAALRALIDFLASHLALGQGEIGPPSRPSKTSPPG